MDPLSAIRQFITPGLGAAPLPKAVEEGVQSVSIPAAQLETLAPNPRVPAAGPAGVGGQSFDNLLGDFVREVNTRQGAANAAVNGLLRGDNVSLHQTMIAMQEASVSFQLMVEVRNKLLESYQELMRMQL